MRSARTRVASEMKSLRDIKRGLTPKLSGASQQYDWQFIHGASAQTHVRRSLLDNAATPSTGFTKLTRAHPCQRPRHKHHKAMAIWALQDDVLRSITQPQPEECYSRAEVEANPSDYEANASCHRYSSAQDQLVTHAHRPSNAKVERRGTATRLALYSRRVRSNAC
jgi:hypothetical protein